jgi:hypothetical protein
MTTASRHSQPAPHRRLRCGLRVSDHTLEPGQEPPRGAHLVTPRRAYTHHGIYAGQGRVLQYGGGLRRTPVEEVALSRFSDGRPIWIRLREPGLQDRPEVVHRARSRLGEARYHVLRNNCEHFCEWCVRGEHRSYQVDELVGRVESRWLGLLSRLRGFSLRSECSLTELGRPRARAAIGRPSRPRIRVCKRHCGCRGNGANATPPDGLLRELAGASIFDSPVFYQVKAQRGVGPPDTNEQ